MIGGFWERWIVDEQIDFLNKVVKTKNKDNQVQKIDVTQLYEKEFCNIIIKHHIYIKIKQFIRHIWY